MARAYSTPEQWGQGRDIAVGEWRAGQAVPILTRDAPRDGRVPVVNSLLCAVDNQDVDEVQRYFIRWLLRAGVGGTRREVRFDATRFTRIALPLEAFDLSLYFEPYTGDNDEPAAPVGAFATVAEGAIATDEHTGPNYTEFFNIAAAGVAVQSFEIPVGATAVRISGEDPNQAFTPFQEGVQLTVFNGLTTIMSIRGRPVAGLISDPSLYTLYASGGWLRLPGSSTTVRLDIFAPAVACRGFVQFKIDL